MAAFVLWVLRHRRAVVVGWVIVIVAGGALAVGLPGRIVPGGETPASSQSDRVAGALAGSDVPSLFAVVETAHPGQLAAAEAQVAASIRRVARVAAVQPAAARPGPKSTSPPVPATSAVAATSKSTSPPVPATSAVAATSKSTSPPVPATSAVAATSKSGTPAVPATSAVAATSKSGTPATPASSVVLQISTRGGVDGSIAVAHRLNGERGKLGPPGTTVLVGGFGAYRDQLTTLSRTDLESAEKVGLPILFVVLFLTFGSLAASVLPMVVALSALVIGLGVVGAVAMVLPMSDFVTNASSMIGIALGVDYTMFLVQRFREATRAGADLETAITTTMATTGKAVLWSGVTVLLAEATLLLVDSRSVRSAAFGMVVVTACAVAITVAVVPIAFAVFGDHLTRSRFAGRRGLHRMSGWKRWGMWVTRRPALLLAAATLTLGVIAIPALHLTRSVNISAASTLPASSPTRQAYTAAEAQYGPDAESPVIAAVEPTSSHESAAVGAARLAGVVRAVPDVAAVSTVALSNRAVAVVITTRTGPYAAGSRDLVNSLRDGALHRSLPGVSYAVGGETAMSVDATGAMFGGLLRVVIVLGCVVGLLLFFALRSVLLPLKAVALVALSLVSGLGGLLALTGSSFGARLIGAGGPEALHPIVPVTIVAIIVALSTDYEVILISRMAEAWARHGDNRESIVEGLAQTGGVITSAAAVMIAVFIGFGIAQLQPLKQLGLGLSLAVFLDATIVRSVLVPAAMTLMGRWNWWRPSWTLARSTIEIGKRAGDPELVTVSAAHSTV